MNIVVMMAGDSDGFSKDGYQYPKLLTEVTNLDYVYGVCEAKLDEKNSKKIFPKIITQWDRVETNFKLMDLHDTALDDKEKEKAVVC